MNGKDHGNEGNLEATGAAQAGLAADSRSKANSVSGEGRDGCKDGHKAAQNDGDAATGSTTIPAPRGHDKALVAKPANPAGSMIPVGGTGQPARVRLGGDITGQKAKTLPAALLNTDLDEIYGRTRGMWVGESLYPEGGQAAALARVAQLLAAARLLGCKTLGQLIDKHRAVLTEVHKDALDGVSLTGFLSGAVAGPLHRDRNLLLAVASTAAVNRGVDPTPLLGRWVKLQRRTGQDGRPAFDDEIVLFRLYRYAGAGSGDERRIQGALSYVLIESGARPYETTQATAAAFDRPLEPSWFDAPGVHTGAARADRRRLRLDDFGRALAAKSWQRLHDQRPTRTRLVYDGQNTGAAAAVGQNRACGDMIRDLGLGVGKFRDLTAASIYKWRAATALDTDGIAAAMNITGMDEQRTYQALRRHLPLPEQRPDSPSDPTF